MATAQQLAAALLSRQVDGSPVADLLWERAGGAVHSVSVATSSPELTLSVTKSSLDAALQLVPVLSDPVALDLVCRKDDRKRVRRLVAANPASSRATLLFLLSWALRPRVQDGDTVEALLSREELSWDDFSSAFAKAEENPCERWYQMASLVERTGTVAAYRSAFSLQYLGLTEMLLPHVVAGKVEGLSLADALELASPSPALRQRFLGDLLGGHNRKVTAEVARLVVAELPVWESFPHYQFRSGSSTGRRGLSEEAIAIFDAARDDRLDLVLATAHGVPEEVRLRLCDRPETMGLLSGHHDLPESVLTRIVEAPFSQSEDFAGRPTRQCVAAHLVGRHKLPDHLANRLVERIAAGEFAAQHSSVFTTMRQASPETRIAYLRNRGNWNVTQQFLQGNAGPVSEAEVVALFSDPGMAFAYSPSGGPYGSPLPQVVPSDRREVAQLVLGQFSGIHDKPWAFSVLDQLPGVLSVEMAHVISEYLWLRLEPVRSDRHLLEAFLSLAPEWTGTLPELVDVVLITA